MSRSTRSLVGIVVVTGGVAVLAGTWWLSRPPAQPQVNAAARTAVRSTPSDPFSQTLAILTGGGDPVAVDAAIEFLDTAARLGKPLDEDRQAALLAALERDTPKGMGEGEWAHLFNSACNALATGSTVPDKALVALLERSAASDPRLVMRLYALQHLGLRYAACESPEQERIRALVRAILADPQSPVAGTALVLSRLWETPDQPGEIPSLESARVIAADPARPVDVRVAALHVAGDDPGVLPLARRLAADSAQPVILRKSALNLIGRHGAAEDLALLRRCGDESSRLAQAGEPAARSLEDRLAGRPMPILRPYK